MVIGEGVCVSGLMIVTTEEYVRGAHVCLMNCVNYPAMVFYRLLQRKWWAAGVVRKAQRVFVVIRMWVLMRGKRMQMGYRLDVAGMAQQAYEEVQ
jgi:hypothetical protein